jgi:catabolite regulation protein CreA
MSSVSPKIVIGPNATVADLQVALRDAADLGTVVVTGWTGDDEIVVDVYTDLHVRGLTLVVDSPASMAQ